MESPRDGTHELERHLEDQMRAQERQLARVRLGMAALAVALVLVLFDRIGAPGVLLGLLGVIALHSLSIPWLLRRFPAREVGFVSTALDMAAVTVAVYLAPEAVDAYLFYGLVILGAALRFGLGASIWSALVMSGLYAAVVLSGTADASVRDFLPVRIAYLIGFGVVAGLFSRVVIGRAAENARLAQQLAEDERDRRRRHEREHLSRFGRDVSASLDREATLATVASGAASLLGDATLVLVVDEPTRRLVPAAHAGDAERAARWRAWLDQHPAEPGTGIIGEAAAAAAGRQGSAGTAAADVDGLATLGFDWLLAVPILAGGHVLGVLATAGAHGTSYEPRLQRMAEALADRAGPALQNAQLWSDLQERMAREQAAQRAKDDFLSVVSHELRTPLTSIQGYAQLLEGRLRGEGDGQSKELAHLRVIRSQVGRMRRLVDDLLDVSRIDRRGGVSIEPVDFDLAHDLRAAARQLRREHNRELEVKAPETLPVHADRDRIDQVLTNLLENAVKYSPDGGLIRIDVEPTTDEVEVRVSDSGVGIPAEHLDHVFERFYQADDNAGQRRFGGLGLGLYISRAIIDAHGGRIWATENRDSGRGCVFAFRMPLVAEPPRSSPMPPEGEPPHFVTRHHDT